ncbi:MAG: alanine--tRNA ligase, partial [Burkholderiaceae bacterium]|nr:alanine--tRNA ligase [Burkholderiaceae bacterium]
AAVLQHVHSNYEIDLFQELIAAAARETGASDLASPSLKVIADHIRACAFLVVDGVIPGNEGRGYVLRRIVRRALRHGHQLGCADPFFHRLVEDLDRAMGAAYPELRAAKARVAEVLRNEEERFGETLAHGMGILESALAPGLVQLDGETAFKLYDTYGFPLDLTADVCRERGVSVDSAGFEAAMRRQRDQARAAGKFQAGESLAYDGARTEFVGYDTIAADARVAALYVDGVPVQAASLGQQALLVLDTTPFYAESGGQAGDRGEITAGETCTTLFAVRDTTRLQSDVFAHSGELIAGELRVGDKVHARVDGSRRASTMRNHSATHLMHKALRAVLGAHVQQKGSLVDAEKTRFDFSHDAPLGDEQIRRVEAIVNREILANAPVRAEVMAFDDAVKGGAMALFGEKYGETVRVLDIGFSRELCGGTHVARTGDIGLFKVVSEGGVAAGIRRVEAVTGENALAWVQQLAASLAEAAALVKSPAAELSQKIGQMLDNTRALEKELARLKSKMAASQGDDLASRAVEVKGIQVLAAALDGADLRQLRETMDKLKDKLKTAAIVLASVDGSRVNLIAGVTPDSVGRVKAGELVNFVAQQVGGKGGGRPDMAQAGGTDPSKLSQALEAVHAWVGQRA